ncbi:MAG: hypothetical protein NVSMB22_25410 [Chloroflexota bacterium]
MKTAMLAAPDISCDHCKNAIEREVGALAGVHAVAVDIVMRHVSVTYDPARIALTGIIATLEDEGYPVTGTV